MQAGNWARPCRRWSRNRKADGARAETRFNHRRGRFHRLSAMLDPTGERTALTARPAGTCRRPLGGISWLSEGFFAQ